MNEDWYGDRFKDNFLTDRLLPLAFACIPVGMIVYLLVKCIRGLGSVLS